MLKNISQLSVFKKILSLIFIISLAGGAILHLTSFILSNKLYDQQAANRWDDNESAYQFSVFFDNEAETTPDTFKEFEYYYSKDLKATLSNNDQEEPGKPFTSAYMAEGKLNLSTERAKMDSVKTYGVSGDYFLFHPLEMITGGTFIDGEAHDDGIIIDEDTAWQLFGSFDIVGLTIDINGIPAYIKGVYKENDTRLENAAKGYDSYMNTQVSELGSVNAESAKSLVYVSYSFLVSNGFVGGNISSYELVSVASSESFVYSKILDRFKNKINHMEIVKNSSRFGYSNLYSVLRSFDTRSMDLNHIYYPYYENVARAYEDRLAILLLCEFLSFLIALVLLIIYIRHKWKNRTNHLERISDKLYDYSCKRKKIRIEKHKQKRLKKKAKD